MIFVKNKTKGRDFVNRTMVKGLLAFLCVMFLLFPLALPLAAEGNAQNPENRMAYTLYVVPQFGDIPNAFSAYSMDIYVENGAPMTYWSLANFNMHISEKTKEKYPGIEGGGAYAGVQLHTQNNPRKAVLAFWEWEYDAPNGTRQIMYAKQVHPASNGETNFYGGGGTIVNYEWQDQRWYRMMLYTWQNEATGTTFCGFWIADLEDETWTLISVYDTKLYDSYLEGNMHFFMENFVATSAGEEHDFRIKNISAQRYDTGEWVMIDTALIKHCNNWGDNKIGKHSFGATEEYFWGKSGGFLNEGESQAQHDADWPEATFTVTEIGKAPTPEFVGEAPILNRVALAEVDRTWRLRWDKTVKGNPIFSYRVVAKDREGNELYSVAEIDPSVFRVELDGLKETCFYVDFEVTDMFGNKSEYQVYTDDYVEKYGETTGSDPDLPLVLPPQPKDNGPSNTLVILGIVLGAVVLITVVAVISTKKEI